MRLLNKLSFILIAAASFVSLAVQSASSQEYKIGLVAASTGYGSFIGDPFLQAATMAVDQANAKGGINGKKVELIVYDTEGSPDKTLVFVKRLIQSDKVSIMLGPDFSGTVRASMPTIEAAKIPTLYNTPIIPPRPDSYHFTPWPSEETGYRVALKSLQGRGVKKLAVIATTDVSGASGLKWVEGLYSEYGMELVKVERMEATDKDVTAQLTSINAAKPDAVFSIGSGAIVAVVCKGYTRLGFKQPLMLSTGAVSAKFHELLKGITPDTLIFASYNMLVADTLPDSDPIKKPMLEFMSAYKEKTGQEADFFASSGFDLANIAIDALKAVGTDNDKIKAYIESLTDYPAMLAPLTFTKENHRGAADSAFVMVQFKDDKFFLTD